MSTLGPDASGDQHFANASPETLGEYPHLLNRSQTRIVHIQPGSQSTQFVAYLEVIDLDFNSRPCYDAISYTCGDLTPVSSVYLTDIGIHLPIARNLTDAINRVLQDGIPGPFWIDAISINQTDVQERNQQVRLMTRIFVGAQQVLMWLGSDDGTLQSALRLLCKWANPCNDINLSMDLVYQIANTPQITNHVEYIRQLDKETTQQEWEILRAFFGRPYFRRAWIVQEISIGQNLQVLCGVNPSFSFELLWLSAWWLMRHSELRVIEGGPTFSQSSVVESRRVMNLQNMRRHWQKWGGVPCSLLHTAYLNESRDPRDKFFATQGIFDIPAEIRHHFEVDYERPLWRVYGEAARGMIRASGSLHVLTITTSLPSSDLSFPTWVPRFDGRADTFTWHPDRDSWTSDRSKVSSIPHASPGTEPCLREDSPPHILSLLGIKHAHKIAKVISLSPPGFSDRDRSDISLVWEWYEWPAAVTYGSQRSLPLWTSDQREIAKVFAECTTMRYRCRNELRQYSSDVTTIFADFRAYLHLWLEYIASNCAAMNQSHDFVTDLKVDLETWDQEAAAAAEIANHDPSQQQIPLSDRMRYYSAMAQFCVGKNLFIAQDGRMGVGPAETNEGDQIVVFFGAATPFVVRRDHSREQLRLVGSAWVDGLMEGEAMEGEGKEGEWFDLS